MDKRLQVDILRQIFNNISDEISENPPALLPLAQVSRGFHSVVTPLIYRIINIKRYNKNGQQYAKSLLTRLSTNTVVRSFIREIRVSDQAGTIPRDVQELLADLLPRLRRLNALHWLYQEHVDNWKLLDNLCQHWPEFRLDLRKVTLLRAHADPMVLAKAHLMLRSLAVQIRAFDLEENPKIKLFQLLETCPHLQILDIRWDFGDPDHEIPISMDIGPLPRLRELSVPNDIFTAEELRWWGNIGDWTRLGKVTLMDSTLLPYLRGCETILQSITLLRTTPSDQRDLVNVCSRFERLEERTIIGSVIQLPITVLPVLGDEAQFEEERWEREL